MSFLFGKKDKKQNAPPQRSAEAHGAVGSGGPGPNINGVRSKERGAVTSPPPGASVNNSANSVDDTTTPSPERIQGQRGRVDSDLQVRFYPVALAPCLIQGTRQLLRHWHMIQPGESDADT